MPDDHARAQLLAFAEAIRNCGVALVITGLIVPILLSIDRVNTTVFGVSILGTLLCFAASYDLIAIAHGVRHTWTLFMLPLLASAFLLWSFGLLGGS